MKLLFAHGWGFDNHFWDNLIEYLPKHIEIIQLDFGYTGNEICDDIKNNTDFVCIGHSLGCLWLLKHIEVPKFFIPINGFDCFYTYIPEAEIQRIIHNLDRKMSAQMRGFYKACGTDLKKEINWNMAVLKEGLHWLANWNLEEKRKMLSCPIKALCSQSDKIITTDMSTKIWGAGNIIWSQEGGHVLPLIHPEWCAQQIMEVINAL